jgi:hypothetical protein
MNPQTAPEGLRRAIEQHHVALNQFINGDTRLWKELCSKQDDVTMAGGWGGYGLGWKQASARYDWAATRFQNSGASIEIENISLVATSDLAYTVDIERSRMKLGGVGRNSSHDSTCHYGLPPRG